MAFLLEFHVTGSAVSVSVSQLLLVVAHLPIPALNESARGVKESQLDTSFKSQCDVKSFDDSLKAQLYSTVTFSFNKSIFMVH